MKKETPKDGLHTEYFDNGQKYNQKSYKDGKLDGKFITWHGNGQKLLEVFYKDGKHEGKFSRWHWNGQIKELSDYKDGKLDGKWTEWYEDGLKKLERNYKQDKLDGKRIAWDINGKKEEIVNYKDDKLEGKLTIFFNPDQKEEEINYKDGKLDGKRTFWYENGQKRVEANYKQDKLDGNMRWWYENAQKEQATNYNDDKLDGKWTAWYENGEKKAEANYKQDKLDGNMTWWYENTQKGQSSNFKQDKLDGKWIAWHENGQVKVRANYIKDKLYGNKYSLWDENGKCTTIANTYLDQLERGLVTWNIKDHRKSDINFKDEQSRISSRVKSRLSFSTQITYYPKGIDKKTGRWSSERYRSYFDIPPVWFSYHDNFRKIDEKVARHKFSPKEEEQILSLINLQEIFRFQFSEFCDYTGKIVSSEITYEYLNKIGDRRWDYPLSLEEIGDQWEYLDGIYDDNEFNFLYGEEPRAQKISKNKIKQFHDRFEKLNITFAGYDNRPSTSNEYKIINTWLYTLAEDIVEQWALKNNLDYHDYNNSNQYAPQDCRIDGVDVDVKTTTGIGRQHLKNFYRYKSEEDKAKNINEIIIGISSRTEKDWDPYLSDTSSSHVILGIYDPSIYSQINLELKHFKPSNNLINVCYFQSLESYFNIETALKAYKKRKYDPKIIDYLTQASLKGY
ncbi:toxin-antitoxin system YwqK family antitoxin, partial [Candidatus Thioglobus sp.]|nr:toxin-antitoxin system YwqK family antitoxin [Candidatus Thioglobus sp.]